MISRLIRFQEGRGRFKTGAELSSRLETDIELKKDIEYLSRIFLNETVSGCKNCYTDKYVKLMKLNPEQVKKKSECPFELRRGALIYDAVNKDVSLNMTQANITTELALYHLKTSPNCIQYFTRLPENWKQMVETYTPEEDKKRKKPRIKKQKNKKESIPETNPEEETNPTRAAE